MITEQIRVGQAPAVKRNIKSVKGWPLLGNTVAVLKDPLKFLVELRKNNEDVVKVRIGAKSYIIIQSPEGCRHVLQENARNYYKPGAAKMMKKFLGDGLATSNGKLWLKQRRLIQPAFHRKKLEGLVNTINAETDLLVHTWKNRGSAEPIDINQEFLKLTLGNITKTMFGTGMEHNVEHVVHVINDLLAAASNSVTSIVKLPLFIPTRTNRRYMRSNRSFEKIIYSIIESRREKVDESGSDLLDLLMHSPGETQMSAKQLRDEITTIFMAGHETTAQTLSWVFYQLALDPSLLKMVKDESGSLAGNSFGLESMQQLIATKNLIEETMRVYPPVWVMARKSFEDDTICGYRLSAGSTILINTYGMNHFGGYWDEPGIFNPARFASTEKEKRHPFLFIPFGGGQRVCIGNQFAMMIMLVVVAKLVREFNFETVPGPEVVPEPNVTLRAKGGIKLFICQNH